MRTARALASGDKREGSQADWTKVKFDRQIVAIAMVANASLIISDDDHVAAIGERWGIVVKSIEDLPIPAELIPPPLFKKLEEEDEAAQEQKISEPIALEVRRSGDGHPKSQAGKKAEVSSEEERKELI